MSHYEVLTFMLPLRKTKIEIIMDSMFDKPFTFDRVVRIGIGVLLIGALLYLIVVLRNALLPFLIAWLMAYMCQPFVKFFQYKLKLKSRILSILAVLISICLIIALVTVMVVPSISEESERLLQLLSNRQATPGYIPLIPNSWVEYLENSIDPEALRDFVNKENILQAIKQIAPKAWHLLTSTFSVLVSVTIVFVIFLYFIFILLDYEKIASGWLRLIPERYRPFISQLADDVELSMNRYFRGQSLIALCVGVLLAIGFKIINFPLAVTLGLFIGCLNLIPYLQTIGLIPMALLSLLRSAETGENFWILFGLSLLVLGIVQAIQDLYLTPRIMGKAMGLNPAIILLSLSIWGTLLGFIGLIIALPLTTLCLSYYKRFILMENLDISPENEVTDPENKLLYATAVAVAANPGTSNYNPFYIYGASGLGKTHLLFAIANRIRETHPEVSLIYTRAEEFIRHYVESMARIKKNPYDDERMHFQDLYTSYDVFIVDDIQNFIKADKTRDTFFDIIAITPFLLQFLFLPEMPACRITSPFSAPLRRYLLPCLRIYSPCTHAAQTAD